MKIQTSLIRSTFRIVVYLVVMLGMLWIVYNQPNRVQLVQLSNSDIGTLTQKISTKVVDLTEKNNQFKLYWESLDTYKDLDEDAFNNFEARPKGIEELASLQFFSCYEPKNGSETVRDLQDYTSWLAAQQCAEEDDIFYKVTKPRSRYLMIKGPRDKKYVKFFVDVESKLTYKVSTSP
jgi:hypothetical protein